MQELQDACSAAYSAVKDGIGVAAWVAGHSDTQTPNTFRDQDLRPIKTSGRFPNTKYAKFYDKGLCNKSKSMVCMRCYVRTVPVPCSVQERCANCQIWPQLPGVWGKEAMVQRVETTVFTQRLPARSAVQPETIKIVDATSALASGNTTAYAQAKSRIIWAGLLLSRVGVSSEHAQHAPVRTVLDQPLLDAAALTFVPVCQRYHTALRNHSTLFQARQRAALTAQQETQNEIERAEGAIKAAFHKAHEVDMNPTSLGDRARALLTLQELSSIITTELESLAEKYKPLTKNKERLVRQNAAGSQPEWRLHKRNPNFRIHCKNKNSQNVTWAEAFNNMTNAINVGRFKADYAGPLQPLELMQAMQDIADSSVVLLDSLGLNILPSQHTAAARQIACAAPTLFIQQTRKTVFVDVHEILDQEAIMAEFMTMVLAPEAPASAVLTHGPAAPTNHQTAPEAVELPDVPAADAALRNTGGVSAYHRPFPDLVQIGLKHVMSKSWGAQVRRRDSSCDATGVETSDLRDHMMAQVVGLQEFITESAIIAERSAEDVASAQMSEQATERLFLATHKGRKSAERAHGVIPARVPPKKNNKSKKNDDQHACAAQVKMGREFAFDPQFKHKVVRGSWNGMVKLKCGILAVSRHHQIRRHFMVGDEPDYDDHDFPFPGYLVAPYGVMYTA